MITLPLAPLIGLLLATVTGTKVNVSATWPFRSRSRPSLLTVSTTHLRVGRPSHRGEAAVGCHAHGARLVRSRCVRHFVPTTGRPAPQNKDHSADRKDPDCNYGRPHQYLRQPHAPLDLDNPLLRATKSGQAIHALPD